MNERDYTRKFYNSIAHQSFIDWFNNETLLPTLSRFINQLPEKPTVLDLGCGTGGESKRLYSLGANVIGIDFSQESLKYARENVPNVEFINMDIIDMDFPSSVFDGIIEAGVLFHLKKEEQQQILGKIITILKPNGIFLSYYPEGEYEGLQEMNNIDKRYARQLPINVWIEQVMEFGFRENCMYEFNLGSFKCIEFRK